MDFEKKPALVTMSVRVISKIQFILSLGYLRDELKVAILIVAFELHSSPLRELTSFLRHYERALQLHF